MNPPPDPIAPKSGPHPAPTGDHPSEVAARTGFGPLSPRAREVWHGDAAPCVTCGQLVRRAAPECPHCGQDLRPEMLERMRAHAGPWYVLEHVRPFPGVSLERIIRQIHRGLITETSILRGPNTDHRWRFAVETPGLSIYFLRCWRCHAEAAATDAFCPRCHSHLFFDFPVAQAVEGSEPPPRPLPRPPTRSPGPSPAVGVRVAADSVDVSATRELERLRDVLEKLPDFAQAPASTSAPAKKPYWMIAAFLAFAIVLFLTVAQLRSSAQQRRPTPSPVSVVPPATPSK